MSCDRDMCFHNIWNDIPCEECPCYEEQEKGGKKNDNIPTELKGQAVEWLLNRGYDLDLHN